MLPSIKSSRQPIPFVTMVARGSPTVDRGFAGDTYVFLEGAFHVGPHLLEVLLPVLGEQRGKGALLCQGVGIVFGFELVDFPVVDGIVVPSYIGSP